MDGVHAYSDGLTIQRGDRVRFCDEPATIREVVHAGTREAEDWSCPSTGGVLIDCPNVFGLVLIAGLQVDEDIVFVSRGDA